MFAFRKKIISREPGRTNLAGGFTIVETIVAGMIMIILCVGVLTAYEHAIMLNRGNSIRLQALTVLQKEVEYYRALKFVPVGPDPALNGQVETLVRTGVVSRDGTLFDVYVQIDNNPFAPGVQTSAEVPESSCQFKEITIRTVMTNPETGWLSNLRTEVSFQRVRLIN